MTEAKVPTMSGRLCQVLGTVDEATCLLCPVRWECLWRALSGRTREPVRGGYGIGERMTLIVDAHGDAREALIAAFHESEAGLSGPTRQLATTGA